MTSSPPASQSRRAGKRPAAQAKSGRGKRGASGAQRSGPAEGLRAYLFDAAADDRPVELSDHLAHRLRPDQLLWVDVDTTSEAAVRQLRALVDLDDRDLAFERRLPVRERGEYFSFRMPALRDPSGSPRLEQLICIVSGTWLVTLHEGKLGFIDAFDEHVHADSSLGALEAPSFAAALLEWELNDYFLALESVQKKVDAIEEAILSDELHEEVLSRLVALRRQVTGLREGLAPHRHVYATLAHPSFDTATGSQGAADFALLNERLEQAVQATDSARETILGAVELYMTMTAQHTNDVMKVLTTVSLLLLPATVLAGVFGMNMLPTIFLHQWFFVIVVGAMVAIGGGLLLAMHRLGWL